MEFTQEIRKPLHYQDFERMCADIYAAVFGEKLPALHGRSRQRQGGVDIFVSDRESGTRVGIQCKRYDATKLTPETVRAELAELDKSGLDVSRYIIATTLPRDAPLLQAVQRLSDERTASGLCRVDVEFWEDLCNHIRRIDFLQGLYAPTMPGGVLHTLQEQQIRSLEQTERIEASVLSLSDDSDTLRDEHGRYLLDAWRQYVRAKPIANAMSLQLAFALLGMFGGCTLFLSIRAASFHPIGYFSAFLFTVTCWILFMLVQQTRRERLSFALPFLNRELLLEVDEQDNLFLTRIRAACPLCGGAMRFRFLGDWRRHVQPRLVCRKNPSGHLIDFDYTSLPEPGSDIVAAKRTA